MSRLRQMLIAAEGIFLRPYRDTNGLLTIGIGRCLETNGITLTEAYQLLDNDIQRCRITAQKNFQWFGELTEARQDVVCSLIFNMGIGNLLQFHRLLAALAVGDYMEAATQMRQSVWARQVGKRARDLAFLMEAGQYGPEAPNPKASA